MACRRARSSRLRRSLRRSSDATATPAWIAHPIRQVERHPAIGSGWRAPAVKTWGSLDTSGRRSRGVPLLLQGPSGAAVEQRPRRVEDLPRVVLVRVRRYRDSSCVFSIPGDAHDGESVTDRRSRRKLRRLLVSRSSRRRRLGSKRRCPTKRHDDSISEGAALAQLIRPRGISRTTRARPVRLLLAGSASVPSGRPRLRNCAVIQAS